MIDRLSFGASAVRPTVFLLCLSSAVFISCGNEKPPANAAAAVTSAVIASRSVSGGMCANGPCGSTFVIHADGRWNYTANSGQREGTLSDEELAGVNRAREQSGIEQAPAFSGTCPTAVDGQATTYTWTDGKGTHEESTCTKQIPSNDPLVTMMSELVPR